MNYSKTLLQKLYDLSEEQYHLQQEYEANLDDWWNDLTQQEREQAFYAVVKRIYKAEIQDKGTYRYALYDVFGFDGGMYMQGMDCGYMELHNIIGNGEDYQSMCGVNRIEVASDNGQAYVKYLAKDERIRYHLQDDNKTLKIFTDKVVRMKLDDQRD
jgi:hypothetical protein